MAADPSWSQVTPRERRVVLKPLSWHNRTGELLRSYHPHLFLIERGYIFLRSIDVGGRTAVIRLSDGSLFVHAPLALTRPLKHALDSLGPVRVVVAPNTEHVDFVAQWRVHYPHAVYLGPPGSLQKSPHGPFTRELRRDSRADRSYEGLGVRQVFIPEAPFFNETVFVHDASGTLLCTDFFWDFPRGPDVPRPTQAFGWGMDHVFKPVYERVLVKDRESFRGTLRKVLDTGFQSIVPCHGNITEASGQQVLRDFFATKVGTSSDQ